MNNWADWLHHFLRGSHIAAGFVGLALFWLVVITRKGTPRHRLVGRCFVLAAYYVGGTAVISSVWALAHVESFAPKVVEMRENARVAMRSQYQFLFSILLFLAIATIAGAVFGRQSARLKENVAALRRTSVPFWQWAAVLAGLGLAVFGGYHLAVGVPEGGMPRGAYWFPFLLGTVGFVATVKEMREVYHPLRDSREWLYRHVEQMFGTGIAFHTAFLIFGGRVWLGPYLQGPLMFLPWIAPLIVGVVATKLYVARLKRSIACPPTADNLGATQI